VVSFARHPEGGIGHVQADKDGAIVDLYVSKSMSFEKIKEGTTVSFLREYHGEYPLTAIEVRIESALGVSGDTYCYIEYEYQPGKFRIIAQGPAWKLRKDFPDKGPGRDSLFSKYSQNKVRFRGKINGSMCIVPDFRRRR